MSQCEGVGSGVPAGGGKLAGEMLSRTSIVEKAQVVLSTRQLKTQKKVPKLLKTRVHISPSENGKINMSGRQQLATINGGGNPRWTSFLTAGTSVFPTFFEKPLSPLAVNKYKGVVFTYTNGEQYTFPEYHAEVLAMFKVGGVADHLGLSGATILHRCRKAVMRCNNPVLRKKPRAPRCGLP